MKHAGPPRSATWLLGLFLPQHDKEMLTGDLVEEYTLLASTLQPRDASRWYWNQVARSAAPMLWANIRRGLWLKTLGAALVGYLAVVLLVVAGDIAMSKLLSASEFVYSLLSLAVGFPAMALGGYVAASMRPRAAIALAVISVVMGVVSLAVTGGRAPLWYQVALIFVGPIASLTGGWIRIRGKERSRV